MTFKSNEAWKAFKCAMQDISKSEKINFVKQIVNERNNHRDSGDRSEGDPGFKAVRAISVRSA